MQAGRTNVPHQGFLQPERSGKFFPVLGADEELKAVKEGCRDGFIVDLEKLPAHVLRRCSQAQHIRSLHLFKYVCLELRPLHFTGFAALKRRGSLICHMLRLVFRGYSVYWENFSKTSPMIG